MKALVVISSLFCICSTLVWADEIKLPGGGCLKCHQDSEDPVTTDWKNDVHAKAGIGCEMCHGGNPNTDDMDEAKSPKSGFKGVPKRADIPEFCGRCHSDAAFMKKYTPLLAVDQLAQYRTSIHGQRIRTGDNKVAQCVSCHGAHGIRKVSDPLSPVYPSNLPKMCAGCHANKEYMAEYKIRTDQYEEYLQSVHGKALLEKGNLRGAPSCSSCHGNHGAMPSGTHMIANVCGGCHRYNADLFLASPMAKPLSTEPLKECVTCHGNHGIRHTSDDLIGNNPNAICMKCHQEGKIGGPKGATFAAYVSTAITKYKDELARVAGIVHEAEQKGMDTMEANDFLQSAQQSLIQARTELHAFSKPKLEAKFNEGYASLKKADASGLQALREYLTRRMGLAISTLLLTIVVIALALKIRSLSNK